MIEARTMTKYTAIPLGLVLWLSACQTAPIEAGLTKGECQRAREHMANIRLKKLSAKGLSPAEADNMRNEHRKNFANSGGERYLERCVDDKTPQWLECTLAAQSLENLARCE